MRLSLVITAFISILRKKLFCGKSENYSKLSVMNKCQNNNNSNAFCKDWSGYLPALLLR